MFVFEGGGCKKGASEFAVLFLFCLFSCIKCIVCIRGGFSRRVKVLPLYHRCLENNSSTPALRWKVLVFSKMRPRAVSYTLGLDRGGNVRNTTGNSLPISDAARETGYMKKDFRSLV